MEMHRRSRGLDLVNVLCGIFVSHQRKLSNHLLAFHWHRSNTRWIDPLNTFLYSYFKLKYDTSGVLNVYKMNTTSIWYLSFSDDTAAWYVTDLWLCFCMLFFRAVSIWNCPVSLHHEWQHKCLCHPDCKNEDRSRWGIVLYHQTLSNSMHTIHEESYREPSPFCCSGWSVEKGRLPNFTGEDPKHPAWCRLHEVQDHRVSLWLGESGFFQLLGRHMQTEMAEAVLWGNKWLQYWSDPVREAYISVSNSRHPSNKVG